jgi:hypothetical protein
MVDDDDVSPQVRSPRPTDSSVRSDTGEDGGQSIPKKWSLFIMPPPGRVFAPIEGRTFPPGAADEPPRTRGTVHAFRAKSPTFSIAKKWTSFITPPQFRVFPPIDGGTSPPGRRTNRNELVGRNTPFASKNRKPRFLGIAGERGMIA